MSLKFVLKGPFENKSTLLQIITCQRTVDIKVKNDTTLSIRIHQDYWVIYVTYFFYFGGRKRHRKNVVCSTSHVITRGATTLDFQASGGNWTPNNQISQASAQYQWLSCYRIKSENLEPTRCFEPKEFLFHTNFQTIFNYPWVHLGSIPKLVWTVWFRVKVVIKSSRTVFLVRCYQPLKQCLH